MMIEKMKQYKNLILLSLAVILLTALIASDPLGFCTQRAHNRAAIRNQMAIEKAEADQRIAIIKAQTDAELKRIAQGDETEGISGAVLRGVSETDISTTEGETEHGG